MKGILFCCIVVLGLIKSQPSVQCDDESSGTYADENVDVEHFDYEPLHYRLEYDFTFVNMLSLDFDKMQNGTYQGSVMIDLKFTNKSKHIVVASKGSAIQMVTARDADTHEDVGVVGYCVLPGGRFVKIVLSKNVDAGKVITLAIQFSNTLSSEKMTGIYLSNYGEAVVIATHFEPLDAALAFPCLDFPKLKASFNMTIRHPVHSHALFNTEPVNTYKVKNNNKYEYKVSEFANTPKMSTYLVALAVHNFKRISTTYKSIDGQTKQINVVLPQPLIQHGQFALQLTRDCLELYEKKFKIAYTLKKVDLIGLPNFEAGAMENWGLITFRLTALVFNRQLDSERAQQIVAETVVHELAHQWFGNLVTMKWWNDIWLNEGFATFMQFYAVNSLYADWRMADFRVAHDVSHGKSHDSHTNTHPISYKHKKNGDTAESYSVKQLFDGISYSKSAALIYMLYEVMGDETFFDAISAYIDQNKFSVSTSESLWQHLERYLHDSKIMEMMNDFTTQPGLPLLTVFVDKKKNVLKIAQKRFFLKKNAKKDMNKWTLPVTVQCFNKNDYREKIVWLERKEENVFSFDSLNFAACDAVKVNKNGNGFFYTDYSKENWQDLARLLSKKEIPSPMDRFNIISDAGTMLGTLRMPIDLYTNITGYSYALEDDYFVQAAVLSSLFSIKGMLSSYAKIEKVSREEGHFEKSAKLLQKFDRYVTAATSNFYSRFKPLKTDRIYLMQEKLLKSYCIEADCFFKLDNDDFVSKHIETFKNAQITDLVNFKLNELIYMLSVVVKAGDTSGLEKVYNFVKSTKDPNRARVAVTILTKTCRTDFIKRMLTDGFNRKIFSYQDYPELVVSVAYNEGHCYRNHNQLAWEYLRRNYAKIKSAYSDSPGLVTDIISAVYSSFVNVRFKDFETNDVSDLDAEFDRYSKLELPMNERAKIIEAVQNTHELIKSIIFSNFIEKLP